MVHFKKFQQDDKLFHSIVDKKKAQLGTSVLIYCSLRRPKASRVCTIEKLLFSSKLSV